MSKDKFQVALQSPKRPELPDKRTAGERAADRKEAVEWYRRISVIADQVSSDPKHQARFAAWKKTSLKAHKIKEEEDAREKEEEEEDGDDRPKDVDTHRQPAPELDQVVAKRKRSKAKRD